jgi:serine protease AprX
VLALVALALLAAPAAALAGKGKPTPGPAPKDATPPTTTITSGPANLSAAAGSVTFTFAANEPATFACSVDGSPFGACSTASSQTLASPLTGYHVFSVRATDLAGNVEQKPPVVLWLTPYAPRQAYLPQSLLGRAQADPTQLFDVIVQLRRTASAAAVAEVARGKANGLDRAQVKAPYRSINGFHAKLPGWLLLYLAETAPVLSITPNVELKADAFTPVQSWQRAVGADALWPDALAAPLDAPTIAVVDSGIDAARAADFGARVLGHVNLSQRSASGVADGDGHGTFVASIAAGASTQYPGVAPTAKLFDVRAMDDQGVADTSDVIAAADWVLANKDAYNIKVANFSLHSSRPNSFKFDPLDKSVESLWLNGVTVVAAAGNFGVDANTPQKMYFAPGNDPFVITVGASDTKDTVTKADDDVAPWSAFGYTADGFAKPDVVAPGRYMIGAVPDGSTIATSRPDHVVAPGYMRLSGTSFAAPAVAGMAANLLALHPGWGPDQVKSALVETATPLAVPNAVADGAGEVDESAAAALSAPASDVNAPLERYVSADATGAPTFDASAWQAAVTADQLAWSDSLSLAWSDTLAWSDLAWVSMAWVDSSTADAALADLAWSDVAKVD